MTKKKPPTKLQKAKLEMECAERGYEFAKDRYMTAARELAEAGIMVQEGAAREMSARYHLEKLTGR